MSCSPIIDTIGRVMKGISRRMAVMNNNKRVGVLEKQINLSAGFMSQVSGWDMKMWKNTE